VAVPAWYCNLPVGLTGARMRGDLFDPSLARLWGSVFARGVDASHSGESAHRLLIPRLFFIRTGAADSQHRTQLQKIEVKDR
jgi:hypothetical protein